MRKSVNAALLVSSISLATLVSSTAFGAAWSVPTNVRVVQKSNTDTTGRVYGTIQAAINSIGNSATATTPYVVQVEPGVYAETITMKSFVDVVGSGRENTIITSNVNNVDFDTCTVGTVLMAENSSIRNLKVVNTAPDRGNDNLAAAVIFPNVKATAEQVDILVGSDTVHGARNNGVCTVGSNGMAVLNDVNIDIHNMGGHSNAIITIDDGSMTINNSRLIASTMGGTDPSTHTVDCTSGSAMTGTAMITNSYVESKASGSGTEGGWYSALYLDDCTSTVTNTNVYVNNPTDNSSSGVRGGNLPYTLSNIQVNVPEGSTAVDNWPGAQGKISTSMLGGSIADLTNLKLYNNYDQNLNPIANN